MYPLTFYVKSLPPDVGGRANGPVIRIMEKYRHDKGIYRHELMNLNQTTTIQNFISLISKLKTIKYKPFTMMT
jgi:hypothetical protein